MSKVKEPCPFCGNDGCLVVSDEDQHGFLCWFVVCPSCGARGPEVARHHRSFKECVALAASLWRNRKSITLTRRDFGGAEETNGEGYDFACSECGYCADICEPNFCPNCGREVTGKWE